MRPRGSSSRMTIAAAGLLIPLLLAACASELSVAIAPATCPAGVRSYVALGSSSTEGAGASEPGRTGYVALLHARLGQLCPGTRLTNLGRGGARVDTFLAQLPEIERAQPDVITILPFADFKNTPPDVFRASYAALLDELAPLGATLFFGDQRIEPRMVCGQRPAGARCYGQDEAQRLAEKNRIVAELARGRPWVVVVPIIDQNIAHPEWIAADGQHANDQGHADFADQFWPALRRWVTAAAQPQGSAR